MNDDLDNIIRIFRSLKYRILEEYGYYEEDKEHGSEGTEEDQEEGRAGSL